MTTQAQKCQTLTNLHAEKSAWIIPNPWDIGSAIDMQEAGFKALATSSAAFAYTLGHRDGGVSLEEKLTHCAAMANATEIPVSVDFEDGYGNDPEDVENNIKKLVATGVAGCSIEDFSRVDQKIFDFDHAVERMQAACAVVTSLDMPFQLVARAENVLRKHSDLDEAIKRLQAYSAAGAHVLYAPGLSSLEQVREVAENTDKPINVLSPFLPKASLHELGDAGATRVSLGSALQIKMRSLFTAELEDLFVSGRAS